MKKSSLLQLCGEKTNLLRLMGIGDKEEH